MMKDLAKLEKTKGTFSILAHINEKGKTRFIDIMNEAGVSNHTAYAALGQLVEFALVTQELGDEFPSKKYYTLTKEGKIVAKQIDAMRKVLKNIEKKKV